MVQVAPDCSSLNAMIAGAAYTEGNAVKGGTTANGSIATVTVDGNCGYRRRR